jgi:diguanylate cyclase (GGDEF)-like protein/PAS domain S-box-containing protein
MTLRAWARRRLPLAPLLATILTGIGVAGALAGVLSPLAPAGLLAVVTALFWRDRLMRMALVRQVRQDAVDNTVAVTASEQWFRALVKHSYDITTVLNVDGSIRFVSPSVVSLLGYQPGQLTGRPLVSLLSDSDVGRLSEVLTLADENPGVVLTLDFALWHSQGRWVQTETAVTNLKADPHVGGVVLNTRDVSERIRLQDQLVHQAFHDPLTGLANRALFRQRVEQALEAPGRGPDMVAALFLDLDGFKAVNDQQGHGVGDELLRHVAARLQRCVRGDATVARLGGDEFAVLIAGPAAAHSATEVASRITTAIAAPVSIGDVVAQVRVSTGIAVAENDDDADALLRNADLAMYRAKEAREGGWVRFVPAMNDEARQRIELEDDLRGALARGELAVLYQPVRRMSDGRTVGAEALVRWFHPERGAVLPEVFVPIAEEGGFILPIGAWVLEQACQAAAVWQRLVPAGEPFTVAVNLSGRQLDAQLVDQVRDVLARTGLPAAALTLEFTETVLMERTAVAVELLTQIKQLGVSIAVDDFGTGYSSLSYLSRFPVDILKIDRSFTEQVTRRTPGVELARTIVNLGHSLGMRTVVEGVETAAQLASFQEMGCDLAQGFFFARPEPAQSITDLLAESLSLPEQQRQLSARV